MQAVKVPGISALLIHVEDERITEKTASMRNESVGEREILKMENSNGKKIGFCRILPAQL